MKMDKITRKYNEKIKIKIIILKNFRQILSLQWL